MKIYLSFAKIVIVWVIMKSNAEDTNLMRRKKMKKKKEKVNENHRRKDKELLKYFVPTCMLFNEKEVTPTTVNLEEEQIQNVDVVQ